MHTNSDIILGTLSTGESVPLLPADRRRHLYAVGQTGTGKTGFLTGLMRADLLSGAGFAFLDPHGDASQYIAGLTPGERMNEVISLDPSDPTHTIAYNPSRAWPRWIARQPLPTSFRRSKISGMNPGGHGSNIF